MRMIKYDLKVASNVCNELMKWGKRGLDEENAKDLEEREKLMKKDKQGL